MWTEGRKETMAKRRPQELAYDDPMLGLRLLNLAEARALSGSEEGSGGQIPAGGRNASRDLSGKEPRSFQGCRGRSSPASGVVGVGMEAWPLDGWRGDARR